jgi:hypothetical protein
MSYFLMRYTRLGREDPIIERFEDSDEALERLSEEEKRVRGTNEGVVLLVADDEADLRRTHAHYFQSLNELRDEAEAEEKVS